VREISKGGRKRQAPEILEGIDKGVDGFLFWDEEKGESKRGKKGLGPSDIMRSIMYVGVCSERKEARGVEPNSAGRSFKRNDNLGVRSGQKNQQKGDVKIHESGTRRVLGR